MGDKPANLKLRSRGVIESDKIDPPLQSGIFTDEFSPSSDPFRKDHLRPCEVDDDAPFFFQFFCQFLRRNPIEDSRIDPDRFQVLSFRLFFDHLSPPLSITVRVFAYPVLRRMTLFFNFDPIAVPFQQTFGARTVFLMIVRIKSVSRIARSMRNGLIGIEEYFTEVGMPLFFLALPFFDGLDGHKPTTDGYTELPQGGMRMKKILGLLLLLFTLSCASSTGGIATSNIPLDGVSYKVVATDEITLSWNTFDIGILGFPLDPPPVDRAQSILLKRNNGDALVNLRYWFDRSIYLFITRNRFHLKADIAKINGNRRGR